MSCAEFDERMQSAVPVFAGLVRIHRVGYQHLARGVHHGHFAARADARVQTHDHARPGGRGQQQIAQIAGKHFDGDALGLFSQFGKYVSLKA